MTDKHSELQELARLDNPAAGRSAGDLLSKKFERLMKRQQGEIRQLQGLRWALELLQPGPVRAAIAKQIQQATTEHARRAERLARELTKESNPAGKQ